MTTSSYAATENYGDFGFFSPKADDDSNILDQFGFVPGLKEVLTTRQVHGLEHATVWVLSEIARRNNETENAPDNENLGGLSTERGFYLYGSVNRRDLHRAVREALLRLQQGEWKLAVHPRCGTNLSVSLALTAGLALGVNFFLPKDPIGQLFGLGVAATVATQVAPDLGQSVQKYVTTAIPFNLEVVEISETQDFWGRPAYFVEVRWC
ncbi:MAG: DUF6391 domain-containing protein [Microcystaceae cyanobacterium]